MPRVIVLGSGTALPDKDRSNSGYIWQDNHGLLMLDCGGAPYEAMLKYGLDPLQIRAIFLSHNHPDHIMGLPALLLQLWLAQYKHSLTIFGNDEVITTAKEIITAARLGEHAIVPTFSTLEHRAAKVELALDLDLELRVAPTYHSRKTLALRIEHPDAPAFVYGADSGPCDDLVALAKNAHSLIHECTVSEPFEYHSTPEQAASTAKQAGIERLILTHYSPRWTAPREDVIERVKSIFDGDIVIADDGACVFQT